MKPGVVVLAWSPRVAPGLLTAHAWDLVRGADAVLVVGGSNSLLPFLVDECSSVEVVADLDRLEDVVVRIVARAGDERVVVVPGHDGSTDLVVALAAVPAVVEGDVRLTVVTGSHDLPGARLLDLVAVMDRLRSPGGCAWDAEQTHRSLLTYLVEETYETVEAVETDDLVGLREELGDLLLQVVFHARIGEEHTSDAWSIDDVARGITDKLVRRHPHVFGDDDGDVGAADLEGRWDRLKAAEKGRTSAVEGVPLGQPALSLAAKLHDRAERAGVAPEVVGPAVAAPSDEAVLGDLLLGVVVQARRAGLDPEAALRAAARRYAVRIRALEP